MGVLLVAPQQLFGASFQMSYGIVASLLLLGLPLSEAWQERIRPWALLPPESWNWAQRAGAATARGVAGSLAIGLATAPVSLVAGVLYFRLLTLGAVAANLVVVPLASLALLAGFASMVSGLIGFETGSVVFNHGAALVLAGMDWFLFFAEGVPGMYRAASFGDATLGFAALVGVLALMLGGFHHGWERRAGGFWPPFAFTALVLIWLVMRGPAG
jgi:competence protein ComEC